MGGDYKCPHCGELESPLRPPRVLTIKLMMPPTANNLFPTGRNGRRFKSEDYKAWLRIAALDILNQVRGARLQGRIVATYTFCFNDDIRERDIANYEKAVSDALVANGVIRDDSDIDSLLLTRGPLVQGNEWAHVLVLVGEHDFVLDEPL